MSFLNFNFQKHRKPDFEPKQQKRASKINVEFEFAVLFIKS